MEMGERPQDKPRPNGKKRVESSWLLYTSPRDLPGTPLVGAIADGVASHYDREGNLVAQYKFKNGVEEGIETIGQGAGIKNEGK